MTVTDSNSCQKVDSVSIDVVQKPLLSVSNDTSICLGDTITIGATSNFSNYVWSNASSIQNIVINPISTTLYKVQSFNGPTCFAEDSVRVIVNTGSPINIGPDTTLDATITPSYTYNAGVGFISYLWQDNSSNQTLIVNYSTTKAGTTDTISVIAENSIGCPSVDTAFVFYDFLTDIIESNSLSNRILVYPNPSSTHLNIKFVEYLSAYKHVKLYDMKGKLVIDQVAPSNQESIRLDLMKAKISKGVYLLNIEVGGDFYQEKLIIQ